MSDHISLVGNIVGELEQRSTRGGGPVAAFRLAVGERRFDRERSEWVDGHTSFYSVSAFGELGANALRSLRKGERVVLNGRLRLREWENETARGVSADVVAEAIGHDLRWGTTRFTRAARAGDEGRDRSDSEASDPTAEPTTVGTDGWAVPGAPAVSSARSAGDTGDDTAADGEHVRPVVEVGAGTPTEDGPF
ncbi:single-stranded DNA-binding protein [Microbacterium sp. NPDC090007]|uniref:single-stranded DNA-binding protein n=1 Tax=Microbacterium sp. NPDC090007 TaxID=3364204 RepID=UPI0037F1D3AC